jgi:hypothetical protein
MSRGRDQFLVLGVFIYKDKTLSREHKQSKEHNSYFPNPELKHTGIHTQSYLIPRRSGGRYTGFIFFFIPYII